MMAEQAKVPAIRFAGFTDPWEQRKLGELALTYSGGTPSAGNSAYYGGEIPFIRSAEIDCDSTELSLTVAGLNNSSAKLVDKGMVLYAMYGATSGEVAISKIKGAINQAILAMDASDMAANRFIAYWLRRQKKSITETFLQGGQGNLSGAIIKELGIPQPSLDEQRQIGSFFSNLDDLITLHQRKRLSFGKGAPCGHKHNQRRNVVLRLLLAMGRRLQGRRDSGSDNEEIQAHTGVAEKTYP